MRLEIATKVIERLSGLGYEDFGTDEVAFAGQRTTRLEFVHRGGDRPQRRSWEYFARPTSGTTSPRFPPVSC